METNGPYREMNTNPIYQKLFTRAGVSNYASRKNISLHLDIV